MKRKVRRYKVSFLWTVPECAVNGEIGTEAFRRELQAWVKRSLIFDLEYYSEYKVRQVKVED